MTTLIRWNPAGEFASLRNAMDRYFDDRFTPYARRPEMRTWSLAVDAVENEDAYIITASVPGVRPDDLEITVEDGVLTIKGETSVDETVKETDYRLRERRFGSFSRSIRFPMDIDADAIEASYEHGVLSLVVPKAAAVKPKKIAVSTNGK